MGAETNPVHININININSMMYLNRDNAYTWKDLGNFPTAESPDLVQNENGMNSMRTHYELIVENNGEKNAILTDLIVR